MKLEYIHMIEIKKKETESSTLIKLYQFFFQVPSFIILL
jgi:hypothetical protein